MLIGDQEIGKCTADIFREDLLAAGIANGECAFIFRIPLFFNKRVLNKLRFRFTGSNLVLIPLIGQ